MRAWGALLAVAGALTVVSPAAADTVGDGQVITDPAAEIDTTPPPASDNTTDPPVAVDAAQQPDQTDAPAAYDGPPPPPPPPDASGRRGELHVLNRAVNASSAPATSAPAALPAATRATAVPAGAARTLPFTGVNAGVLALIGLALLAAGSGLLAVLREPVQ